MFFWFKKSKVILECFTTDELVYEHAKIESMIKFFPDWWKKTKKIENDKFTIKNCTAILEFYRKGITMPLWTNLKISLNGDGTFEWKSSNSATEVESHHKNQFLKFAHHDGYNIKVISPWIFRTKKEKYFLLSNPIYNNRNLINCMTVMPGVLEFKYNRDVNVNFFLIAGEKQYIEIPAFTPMLALHPLFEESVEIKNFLITSEEFSKIDYAKRFVDVNYSLNLYKEKRKVVDHTESKSKCPFGFK
ncbi:hypothetical protein EBS02_00025 [bacterium]|jgi:hypothetical protein|nr:hypothetical protein [bacterium]